MEIGNFQIYYIPADEGIVRSDEWFPNGKKTVEITDHK